MDVDRWTRAKHILSDFLDAKPDDLGVWLDEHCGDDTALRAEVESLLASYERGPLSGDATVLDWLGSTASESERESLSVDLDRPEAGTHLGGYRLLEEIGIGGMSVVYRAERATADFEQTVAVKLLQRRLHADDAERRFRAERQVLASLDHPNVARLLDGGVSEGGRPYLVMEYVDGQPITEYAAANDLGLQARLDLLEQVMDAVQAAHRRLVVHRDLKPSNVLVTETEASPRVKLLDFGIAKLLDDSLPVTRPETRTGHHLMTPSYAAPEQVTGGKVTTATDTYQVGILAYELLGGARPFDLNEKSLTEIERLVVETDPLPPSERATGAEVEPARLRGDLDVIILKALRKEPERRYPSVEALMADLRRYRAGEPVEAQSATLGYRTKKFVQRNATGVVVATAFLIVLAISGTMLVRQRNQAQREAQRAERVSDFLAGLFEASSPYASDDESPTARDLLRRGQRRLSALEDEPATRAQMLDAMGRAHTGLANYRTADSLLQRALTIRQRLYNPPHEALAAGLTHRAEALHGEGRYAVAESLDREALQMRRRLYDSRHPDVAESMRHLAEQMAVQRKGDRADSLYRRALSMQRDVFEDEHPAVATTAHHYAQLLIELGSYSRAEALSREALAIHENELGPSHPTTITTRRDLGTALEWQGDLAVAESLKHRSLQQLGDQLEETHPLLLSAMNDLAILLRKRGAYARAKSLFRTVLDRYQIRYPDGHPRIALVLKNLGQIVLHQGNWAKADSLFHRSLALHRRFFNDTHTRVTAVISDIAALERARGHLDEAESLYRDVLGRLHREFDPPHPYVAITLGDLAQTLGKQDRHSAADSLFRRALAMKKTTFGPQHQRVASTLEAMAHWQRERGRLEPAEERARQALSIRRSLFGEDQSKTAQSQYTLGRVHMAQDQLSTADSLLRKALRTFESVSADGTLRTARVRHSLGRIERKRGNVAAADSLLHGAYSTFKQRQGPNAPATRRTQKALDQLATAREGE